MAVFIALWFTRLPALTLLRSPYSGAKNTIKLDLQLKRIGKHLELEPHRKFRRATIWVSDDAERLLVRIEAQIFVGTVWAELQSVHFDKE